MTARAQRLFTPDEYLSIERNSQFKSEYVAGKIYAMAGASYAHNLITGNVVGEFYTQLKGRPCSTVPSDMRVAVSSTGLYTYPDVTVVCGEPQFLDGRRDVLLNPTVIVEVLSPSTEDYDRGEKCANYRRLASLTDYLLVAQHRRSVDHYTRLGNNEWLLKESTSSDGDEILPSIGCTLRLADIYDKVPLPIAQV